MQWRTNLKLSNGQAMCKSKFHYKPLALYRALVLLHSFNSNPPSTPMRLIYSVVFLLLFQCSYAQLALNKCKFLGNIIANSPPSTFDTYWNQVTPENSGKWESVESTRDQMNWNALDLAYQYAKEKGFPFKQHAFVWNNQKPAWLSALSSVEIKEEVEEWIDAYGQRYPDTDFIDVVNEPLNAPASYRNALGGGGATGYDWIIWSFEKARAACPQASLLLNEYNIINDNNATDQYLAIINALKSRDLIDGIGVQGHFFELSNATASTLNNNLNKLAATGLPIYISEFDVEGSSDSDQKTKFENLFPILWQHPGVRGITLWGYVQDQIWKPNAYLIRSNLSERPAMVWLKQYMSGLSEDEGCTITANEEQSTRATVNVFPNPTSAYVTIEAQALIQGIRVMDAAGRSLKVVSSPESNVQSVFVGDLNGIYFVQAVIGGRPFVEKIIVKGNN